MLQGVLKKKALEAVTYFKTPFACRASSAGALCKHSRCCLQPQLQWVWAQATRSALEVKTASEKLHSKLTKWQAPLHVIASCWKNFYLFLKGSSQKKLKKKNKK